MFAGGVDTSATDTKGTVLIHSAEQVIYYHSVIVCLYLFFPILFYYSMVLFDCGCLFIYA